MVFEVVSYLILPNRDDDVAVELHLKVGSFIAVCFVFDLIVLLQWCLVSF